MRNKSKDTLIVLTRLPCEGKNKTRLIPALGPAGAAAMHDRLARHAIGRASSFAMMHPSIDLQIHLDGGTPAQGRAWLGNDIDCHPQSSGDLGQRIFSAIKRAFDTGAERVVLIGTDCPSLDEKCFEKAYQSLDKGDLVYVPAADGGYVLVGMSRPIPEVFQNIEWGGPKVLDQSLAAASAASCRVQLLDALRDVDLPEDLPLANQVLTGGSSLSVILPTLNEAANLEKLLERLKKANPHEIIIADGGSQDRTVEIAKKAGVRVISSEKGRAAQMNAAAAIATGEFLLFLHADTLPPENFPQIISRILQQPGISAGAFSFALSGNLSTAHWIETLVNLRCRFFQTPYGDQGMFLRRQIFTHLGGFPDWQVMEDFHFIRRLKSLGRVSTAEEIAHTSPRRWQDGGTIRTFLRHQLMLGAYHIGVPARHIAKLRP